MAERLRLTRTAAGRAALVRWRLTPWWGRVLIVYAASRVVTSIIMVVFARVQAQATGGAVPSFFAFASNWDGQWYWQIAAVGYPSGLPLDDGGHVAPNAWAFLPAYPLVLSVFVHAGFPFPLVAVVVSLVAGACAALLFFRMMREAGLASASALFAVVLLCTAPVSALFQVAYAEAMALALLFLALLLVQRRRFWAALPVIVLVSLTRPLGLALALFLLLYLVARIVRARRDRLAHPLAPRETAGIVVAGLVSVGAGLTWPAIAWAVTGSPSAYTDTELAWRAPYVGFGELVPFQGWLQGLAFWLRFLGVPDGASGPLGVVAVLVLVGALAVFLVTPWARRLGLELRLWLASYAVYLLAVFFPQSSTFRLLLPLSPALGAFAVPGSRLLRAALVVLGIAGQVLWVWGMWMRGVDDWSPP